jgi:hypothetical protein
MHLFPVQRIHYAFDSRGLTKSLVQQHADFAKAALAQRFDISPEDVEVVPRSCSDSFQLTCYTSKSTTCPAALVFKVRMPALATGGRVGEGGAAGGGMPAMAPNAIRQISVAPSVTISADQVSAALMQDPGFRREILTMVNGSGNKIQSAWR